MWVSVGIRVFQFELHWRSMTAGDTMRGDNSGRYSSKGDIALWP
jgi:hypothetical protein